MGLDMYLRAEKYIPGYDFYGEEKVSEYKKLVDDHGVSEAVDPETPTASISFTVAYWRKANHIHQWFVVNVQNGEDECRPHYVSRKQLKKLREACEEILALRTTKEPLEYEEWGADGKITHVKRQGHALTGASRVRASQLLPTQAGFFFGGTEYDEWYLRDLEHTIKQIDRALTLGEEWSFEYQSSW